ncbi:hypothetical protein X732_14475 [Mesorhizobium sp. L2C066B000]|nr:hypothetical protein X732_14475 [Mesorhizobium sp. L2C066B000]
MICAELTALSSIFLAMYTRSILPSSHGNFYELYAIAAAVLEEVSAFCWLEQVADVAESLAECVEGSGRFLSQPRLEF